jgi:hypothetical protein
MKYNIQNTKGQTPAWLSPDELEQAQALISLDFHFCGDRWDYCVFEDNKFGSVAGWKFYGSCGEIALDVVYKNALYSKCLDDLDGDWDKFLVEIKEAKKALRKVINEQKSRVKQLSLWEVKHG